MPAPTRDDYRNAFVRESTIDYPRVREHEGLMGRRLDPERLLAAAEVLACPVKTNPPNWQHGRVIYATLRNYLDNLPKSEVCSCFDIGTAKGFSALCMRWALDDAGRTADFVISVDVVSPMLRVPRNTVAEVDGLKTLHETLTPWQESKRIRFWKGTGIEALGTLPSTSRLNFAFVDGKHSYDAVSGEARLLGMLQRPGDIIIFDDTHIEGVRRAVDELDTRYAVTFLEILPMRSYAIARRR